MSSRKPGLGQEALFAVGQPQPQVTEPELRPAYTNVAQRAFELGETLKALNRANMSAGLQIAAATPHRTEIEQRYGDRTDQRVHAAGQHESIHIRNAKTHFARATGMYSLIGAGHNPKKVTADTRRMFDAFTAHYGVGVANAKIRNKAAKRFTDSAARISGSSAPVRKTSAS